MPSLVRETWALGAIAAGLCTAVVLHMAGDATSDTEVRVPPEVIELYCGSAEDQHRSRNDVNEGAEFYGIR